MLKRTASAVEHIVMASFARPSRSRSRSLSPSRLRRSPNPSPSPNRNPSRSPSPSRLRRSPNPSPSQLRLKPSPRLLSLSLSRSHPNRRGSLPPVGGCRLAPAQQNRLLSLLPTLSQHRHDRGRGQRRTRRRFSQPLQLDPALRFRTRASRFRRPPADRRRPLRASRFHRPPVGAGGVRRRVPEEVLAVRCDRRSVARVQGSAHQDALLRR